MFVVREAPAFSKHGAGEWSSAQRVEQPEA